MFPSPHDSLQSPLVAEQVSHTLVASQLSKTCLPPLYCFSLQSLLLVESQVSKTCLPLLRCFSLQSLLVAEPVPSKTHFPVLRCFSLQSLLVAEHVFASARGLPRWSSGQHAVLCCEPDVELSASLSPRLFLRQDVLSCEHASHLSRTSTLSEATWGEAAG